MLSIAKLRVGQEAYQLSGVAQSLDDYYTGAGEATGRWAGIGAERLGLTGDVAADDLRAVLAGLAPGTGGLTPDGGTIRTNARRVPGFDLTFKAPKSVSVLYAVSDDPRVQHTIVNAGETAAVAALGWLEREAIRVRRGSGNIAALNDMAARDPQAAEALKLRVVPASGVVAAMFRHRTSRASDPLLHWHTLVANMAEGPDGRWTALHGTELYGAARAAGEVFQTVLRDELSRELGVQWRPGRHVPEIAGVPNGLLEVFSKRSKQIEDWLAATGTPDDPAGRQAAVLATRRHKPEVESQRFDADWKAEATTFGWGPEQAEQLLTSRSSVVLADVDDAWVGALTSALTEHDSTFTRNDLVQAVAAGLDTGAPMSRIERTVESVLASSLVVPVGDDGKRWTSREMLDVERRLLNAATGSIGGRQPIDPAITAMVLAGFPTIGVDQHAAVVALTGSVDAVSVLVGPAGTGKTFTLDAIRAVFEDAGFQVIGTAPSARAAQELETGAQIPSATMHRRLGSWSRGFDLPDARTVVVVDESAMAGTRELEAIMTTTVRAGGRVLLTGDHHQLPEVTAGGGFAALATGRTVTVAELTVNRRQAHEWERTALNELRNGHVAAAVHAYRDHGRVDVTPDRATMLNAAVTRWAAATEEGLNPVLLAGTNSTVGALNTAVRQQLKSAGRLGEAVGVFAGRELAVGERVVLRRNDYQTVGLDGQPVPLLNGQTATILAGHHGGVIAHLDQADVRVALAAGYLNDGVDYGYALTSHRAQGGTWDLAIAVGAEGLYRESGYLSLSRGRTENRLVLTQSDIDGLDDDLARHDSPLTLPDEEPDEIDTDLIHRLNTSRAKSLALTLDPHADLIASLAENTDLPTLEILAAHARRTEQTAETLIGTTPTALRAEIGRAVHTGEHIAIGQQVKPVDRNNIGTVTSINDEAGTAAVTFVSAAGRTATRTFRWDQIGIVDRNPDPRPMTPEACQTMSGIVGGLEARLERWESALASENVAPDDTRIYSSAARLNLDRSAARNTADQPDWLTHTLGPRPTAPAAGQVWADAVRHVAGFRSRHQVTDPSTPFGPPPAAVGATGDWDMAATSLAEARVWLDAYAPTPAIPLRARSAAELVERRTELEAILASAPADQRHVVMALTNGQLTLTDTTDLLQNALAQQGDRRHWILEHWPHIVEASEIDAEQAKLSGRVGTPGSTIEFATIRTSLEDAGVEL